MLTKSDFMLYLDSPMHLWAKKHQQLDGVTRTNYEKHLSNQGILIEEWAQRYIQEYVLTQYDSPEIQTQKSIETDDFQVITDTLIYDFDAKVYDLYEIKSTTSVKKYNLYDACFQVLVCENEIPIRNVFIVHLNKDYMRDGKISLQDLFVVENVSDKVKAFRDEVSALRSLALQVVLQEDPNQVEDCLKPNDCPCLNLCHPKLPSDPIYNIPRIHWKKKRELKSQGILAIKDIPEGFLTSENQILHADVVKAGKPHLDSPAILADLSQLQMPLYFLDYETYNAGLPWYDGYSPYQQMVFQYSLHVVHGGEKQTEHFECLVTEKGDPARVIVEQLSRDIGNTGSVIVWNRGFEAGRNKEMAKLYPQYGGFLEDLNARMYDLADIFRKGYYVHPDFFGSYSIKNVLPVMANDISYKGMPIPEGTQAMMAWEKIMQGKIGDDAVETIKTNLLAYCEMDTFAMLRIWQEVLKTI